MPCSEPLWNVSTTNATEYFVAISEVSGVPCSPPRGSWWSTGKNAPKSSDIEKNPDVPMDTGTDISPERKTQFRYLKRQRCHGRPDLNLCHPSASNRPMSALMASESHSTGQQCHVTPSSGAIGSLRAVAVAVPSSWRGAQHDDTHWVSLQHSRADCDHPAGSVPGMFASTVLVMVLD